MKADTLDLNEIFRKDRRYVVPMFQRPYVWNEEDHWQLLWEDVRNVVDEFLRLESEAQNEIEQQEAQSDTTAHFLGAVVLDQKTTITRKLEKREIIDGQQRLITLQILFSAAHTVAEQYDSESSANELRLLMYNDQDLVQDENERLKVWPIEPNQEAFKQVMNIAQVTPGSSNYDGDKTLHECYDFFYEGISQWVEQGPEAPDKRIDSLVTTLWSLIKIVVIDLENEDDAQVIFETLNARGTPLLAADLIKNYLFREAAIERSNPEDLHEEYWEQFDEDKWREEVSQGRLERPRIDVFIMHWLTMRMGEQVRAKKLFRTFRRFLAQTEMGIEDILEDIDRYASVYDQFSPPYDDSREGLFFHRLDVLDTTTPYPVLLWIYGQASIPADQRIKAIETIESWLLRRMLCRLTTKNYNNIFIDLLELVQEADPGEVGDTVVDFFQTREGDSDYWPSDEDLQEAIVTRPYWGRINQRRLKMVFAAIERHLRDTGYSETLELTQDLEIEHILPREWAHNWPLPGERPEEVERIEREEMKHTFGNLTILTDELNPSISNAEWETKRERISDYTVLLVNQQLVNQWWDEWNEDAIAERGKWLGERAAEIWHSPRNCR